MPWVYGVGRDWNTVFIILLSWTIYGCDSTHRELKIVNDKSHSQEMPMALIETSKKSQTVRLNLNFAMQQKMERINISQFSRVAFSLNTIFSQNNFTDSNSTTSKRFRIKNILSRKGYQKVFVFLVCIKDKNLSWNYFPCNIFKGSNYKKSSNLKTVQHLVLHLHRGKYRKMESVRERESGAVSRGVVSWTLIPTPCIYSAAIPLGKGFTVRVAKHNLTYPMSPAGSQGVSMPSFMPIGLKLGARGIQTNRAILII